MAAHRVIVLGGGFGGLAAAHTLQTNLSSSDEVIVIERKTHFMMGLRKPWVMTGRGTMEEGQRPLKLLEQRGIQVIQDSITKIDPVARAVEAGGHRLEADALVVALGAELAPQTMPGFEQYAINVYDAQEIPRAAEALKNVSGGKVTIGIFGAPYKCPPAPYEMALLLKDYFAERQVNVTLEVFTPQNGSLPVLGEVGCALLDGRLGEKGIIFLAQHKATSIEAGEVVFPNNRRNFDLLLGVPPHRCPQVIIDSGLTGDAPWIKVNKSTMQTGFDGVYAIGDCTHIDLENGMALPKAGVFAEAEGVVAAEQIIGRLTGEKSATAFDGFGYCFMEVGGGMAVQVRGNFLASPAPEVQMTEDSAEALQEKHSFETERLNRWFGS
jgi:sulfide:quinone oxidoreductase